jgi:GTP pyrophosphokinase
VRQEMIERLREPLEQELAKGGVTDFDVSGRPKHLWSIYQKMRKRNKPFDEIYDLMAMRVIVGSRQECYQVLGVIHHVWTPLQERFKDYIARPKSNGYQSLHTTIFGPGGQLFEIQIRTGEMHRTAEYGIAAHWLYKAGADGGTDDVGRQLGWFRQLLELQQESHSAEEFLEFLKVDLYHDEIFVFTPQGDVKQLPRGATAIDFAFHVHTDVGTRTNGAKVNGRIAPLHRELKNGDTVEVLTSQQAKPSRDWLSHVRTGRARSKIKQWIRQEEETVSRQLGGEILARELKRRRLEMPGNDRMDAAGKALNLLDGDALQVALGRGDLAIGQVMKSLFPELPGEAIQEKPPTMFGRVIDRIRLGRGIKIQGVDGLMVRYAQCCQPVPGDTVVGYVTQGRGISIHRADCPNLLTLDGSDRRVEIDWQEQTGETYAVRLQLTGEDRRGLYADVMQAISQTGTNIRGADLHSKDANVVGNIFVEVDNLPHLAKVLKAVRKVKGVSTVERRESPGA